MFFFSKEDKRILLNSIVLFTTTLAEIKQYINKIKKKNNDAPGFDEKHLPIKHIYNEISAFLRHIDYRLI